MKIELLHRGHFVELDQASAKNQGKNAWEITIPLDSLRHKVSRGDKAEDWDEAIFSLDGEETAPAVGSGEGKGTIKVTVILL